MRRRTRSTSWLLTLALLGPLLLVGCRTARGPATAVTIDDETRRAVWTALLVQAYAREDTKVLVLEPALSFGETNWGASPRSAPPDAWRAFLAAQRSGGHLPRDLDVGTPLVWLPNEDWRRFPEGDGIEGRWGEFHARFPGNAGLITLGPIGFSRDGNTAITHGFVGSGMLSASGDIFVLRKTAAGWKVVQVENFAMA